MPHCIETKTAEFKHSLIYLLFFCLWSYFDAWKTWKWTVVKGLKFLVFYTMTVMQNF